jgi:MFS family permease
MSNPETQSPASTQYGKDVLKIIILTGFCLSAYGLLNPLLIVRMSNNDESNLVIGLVIGIWAVPISLLVPVYPHLVERLSPRRSMTIALVGAALPIGLLSQTSSPVFLVAFQAVGGAFFGLFWNASGAVMIKIADSRKLGRVMSIWGVAPSVGALIGSFTTTFTGFEGTHPFIVSMGFMLCGAGIAASLELPRLFSQDRKEKVSILSAMRIVPALMVIALMSGIFESVPWGMLVAFGIGKGFEQSDAVFLLTVFFLGQCLFAWPVGKFIDAVNPARALLWFSAAGAILSLLLTWVTGFYWVALIVVLIWSPIINAYRATAMVMLGRHFKGATFLAANSVFIFFANSGEIVGPPSAGFLMDAGGPDAMPYLVAFSAIIAGTTAVFMLKRSTHTKMEPKP